MLFILPVGFTFFYESIYSFDLKGIENVQDLSKEQLNRFLKREHDPLKQWKLSDIDVKGLSFWEEYSEAIKENFEKTNHAFGKWCVVKSDDKKRARLQVITHVLSLFDYNHKDHGVVGTTDPKLLGGPEIWSG